MDLRQQLNIIRHWLWLILACLLLSGGIAYIVSGSLPKTYEAKATLIVGQSLSSISPDYNGLLASQRLSTSYAQLVETGPVLQHVIGSLNLPVTTDQLKTYISATAPANNNFVYITADWGDPQTAANIANATANELIAESPAVQGKQATVQSFVDQELSDTQGQITSAQSEVDRLNGLPSRTADDDAQLQTLAARLVQLRSSYASLLQFSSSSQANLLSVVDPAIAPIEPSGPRVLLNTILAAILGLLIALGIAFLVEHLDDTVKSPEDIQEVAGISTLGAIVRMKVPKGKAQKGQNYALTALRDPRAPATEAFRTLRTNLEFASLDTPLRTILVTSAVPAEGKTTVSTNLAVIIAQSGKRVILLDADLRRPGVHKAFDLPNSFGLTNLLRTENLPLESVTHAIGDTSLRVITTGALPPNPAELLGSQRMKDVLQRLIKDADMVIVDSPPLQVVTDAAVLASELDGTLLVIDAGHTRKGNVRQAREALDRVGAHVLGATVNRLSDRAGSYYYYRYYGNYYTAGSSKPVERPTSS